MAQDRSAAGTPPARHPERYAMMAILACKDPLPAAELAAILETHARFIDSGGGGGGIERHRHAP